MSLILWIILLLLCSSGISAYIGNHYGRRFGKKKVSVFSLRPKHSSTFLTVVLSMAFSLGILSLSLLTLPNLKKQVLEPASTQWAYIPKVLVRSPQNTPSPEIEAEAKPYRSLSSTTQTKTPLRQGSQTMVYQREPGLVSPKFSKKRTTFTRQKNPKLAAKTQPKSPPQAPAIQVTKAPQELIAQKDEALFEFETQGNHSHENSQLLVAKALELTQDYAKKIGAKQAVVLESDLQNAKDHLQSNEGTLSLKIEVGENAVAQGHLPVRLKIEKTALLKTVQLDPHLVLERDRLKQTPATANVNQVLTAAIRLKQSKGIQVQTLAPSSDDNSTQASPYKTLPSQQPVETQVVFTNVQRKGTLISGKLEVSTPTQSP